MPDKALSIHVTPEDLELFCKQLVARSRDISKTHDALVSLETFIKKFSASQYGSVTYKAVEDVLVQATEHSRQMLLHQRTLELLQALQQKNIAAVSAIHTPMSRNGFYQILQVVISQLSIEEMQSIRDWVLTWTTYAKHKADECSRYPDAPDFRAAGIVVEDYVAMQDVSRYLEVLKQG